MPPPMPDAASVARFAADLAPLWADAAPARLLVAVSGGPDSLALLLLAQAVLGERCIAATVDHGLRGESADEAAFVAELCAARGIDHAVLTGPLPDRAGGSANLSSRARALRYALLEAHAAAGGASAIATAHHADDQVETMAMRLNRGAGVGGLAGIRARSGIVVRPLLGWRRAELAAIVAQAGITAVDDPTNRDPRFDRARLRPALAAADWIAPDRWTASAQALAEADAALAWMAERLAAERCTMAPGTASLDPHDLPPAIVRRLATRCLQHIDSAIDPRGPALSEALALLARGETAMLGNVIIRPQDGIWCFSPAPPRRAH